MTTENFFMYTLKPEDDGRKLQDLLVRRFHFSRKVIQKLKIGEKAWLDGKFTYLTSRGRAGQTLVLDIREEESTTVQAESLPLDILYEDHFFLAVNKAPGMVVHPNSGYPSGTLANAVAYLWESRGESRPFRPIFRIDRNTSGIVLIAKSRFAHQQLCALSARGQVQKKYLGIVQGRFPGNTGSRAGGEGETAGAFTLPIRRKPGSKIQRETHEEGLPAETRYRVVKHFKGYTLLEFMLVTGRTHQIRVHCQSSGHPLLGDDLYGGDTKLISRQALHCSTYTFSHPVGGSEIRITAPLPEDMRRLLN